MLVRLCPLPLAVLALLAPLAATGQVRTDGSVGAARNLSGPTYAITESLGRRAGNNLFHSFQTLRIGSGETALFSTTTPTIANVIGRVTGGEVSTIDGTIRLQAAAGAPALFLINPAGVVFGAGAVIDMPGAFHVSTADSVRFPDGVFHADPARASTFSSAPPEAFGFLGNTLGAVTLRGAMLSNRDAAFSVVAGDVAIEEGGNISSRGGELKVVAVGHQSIEVGLDGTTASRLQGTVRMAAGDGRGSGLSTESGDGVAGGALRVAAGRVELSGANSGILSFASETPGGQVSVRADEALTVSDGAGIRSYALWGGSGGAVHVRAGRAEIDGGMAGESTGIRSAHFGPARGGDLSVQVAGALVLRRGGVITAETEAFGRLDRNAATGPVGDVRVQVGSLRIEGGGFRTGIGSDSPFWLASRGHVNVQVEADAQLQGGYIASGVSAPEESAATSGSLRVAAQLLRLDDEAWISNERGPFEIQAGDLTLQGRSSISSFAGSQQIAIRDTLRIADGAEIRSSTWDAGVAGIEARRIVLDGGRLSVGRGNEGGDRVTPNFTVSASESMELRNGSELRMENLTGIAQGPLVVTAGRLLLDNSNIRSVGTEGPSGDLFVSVAGEAEIRNGSWLNSSNWLYDLSSPSRIVLRAKDLRLDGSSITSIGKDTVGGRTGDVEIDVTGSVTLRDSRIASWEYATGENRASGAIRVRAGQTLRVEDSDIQTSSSGRAGAGEVVLEASSIHLLSTSESGDFLVISQSDDAGASGRVSLRATGPITMDGPMEVGSRGGNRGGGIEIQATSFSMTGSELGSARILSKVYSQGTAGDIALRVEGPIELRNGASILSSAFEGGASAGAVRIDAGSLLIQRDAAKGPTAIDSSSFPGGKDGGSIDIRLTGDLRVRNGGAIWSSANGTGAAGAIRIEAQNVTVEGNSSAADPPLRSMITAHAFEGASGEMGAVSISARDRILVQDGGRISMVNFATAQAPQSQPRGVLRLAASRIELRGGGVNVGSEKNVDASDIQVDASKVVVLQNGFIITSADGSAGGGGNIRVTSPVMALQTGLLEANAYADGATGGNIVLDVAALLSSHQSLLVGGTDDTFFQLGLVGANVIQAFAPTGVSGNIEIAAPPLDVAGALATMAADTLPVESLGKSPCRRGGGSSLGIAGRGGLAPSAADPVGSRLGHTGGPQPVVSVVRLAGSTGCAGS